MKFKIRDHPTNGSPAGERTRPRVPSSAPSPTTKRLANATLLAEFPAADSDRQGCGAERAWPSNFTGFTLMELLVAIALIAVIVPIIVQCLRVATLAGEVSQRKALAVRIGERVLNEAILNDQTQAAQSGNESAGPYQFRWTLKDEPWTQLNGLSALNNPNSVNQTVVNPNILHQVSVDVTYGAQNRDFSVHLSTLVNVSQQ